MSLCFSGHIAKQHTCRMLILRNGHVTLPDLRAIILRGAMALSMHLQEGLT